MNSLKKMTDGRYAYHGWVIGKFDNNIWYGMHEIHKDATFNRPTRKAVMVAIDKYRATHYRTVTNLMTGELVKERLDTPFHCSVASETYWSS